MKWVLLMNGLLNIENGRNSRRLIFHIASSLFFLSMFFLGCSGPSTAPTDFETLDRAPNIFPDYCDIDIPVNIAPMNFDFNELEYKRMLTFVYVAQEDGNKGECVFSFSGEKVCFSEKLWKKTLNNNVGKTLVFSCYAQKESTWYKFSDWTMNICGDKIDPWISYRKIVPGYEYFSDLALWNRNLETFEERAFFRARLFNERTCINCHSYQNYDTNAFLFHMRITGGGTIFSVDGNLFKRDLKADGMLTGCSYPAWRPNSLHVAFASCATFQTFHSKDLDRIDVLDGYSDLYLYDVANNTLSPILPPSDATLDTYPTWSADGKTLYYCSAKSPGFETERKDEEKRKMEIMKKRELLKYDVKKVSYDERTGRFGEPETVFAASERGKSALFPRISPDGKTLLVTLTEYGCFPIWYRDSDLWAIDLTTGEARNIEEINSPDEPDSYHSWSTTGRWIVFSSRRDDGSYTRLYFSHYDGHGRFSKPFMLPQREPIETLKTMRSYNIPEFSIAPVEVPTRKILKEASVLEPEKAILKPY